MIMETQDLPFKELIFARIKADQLDKYKPLVAKTDVINEILRKMSWSVQQKRRITTTFMNIESMSVFNKGLIIRELKLGELWQVQILHSTSLAPGFIIKSPNFMQQKNYINYSFQRNLFYTWPVPLFQTFGYKTISKIQLTQVQYYSNKMKGIEVYVYPKQAYLQIVQTFPAQIDQEDRQFASSQIFQKVEGFLDRGEVLIEKQTFLPDDFRESVDDGQKIQLLS